MCTETVAALNAFVEANKSSTAISSAGEFSSIKIGISGLLKVQADFQKISIADQSLSFRISKKCIPLSMIDSVSTAS